jgi:galactoside O-acetyltransferase
MTNPTIPDLYKKIRSGKVVIKKHSLIGSTSVVLPGIEIGEGCSFGAFSFINKSTDPWGIYAGIPIKRIKERKKDLLRLENRFLKEFNEKQKGGL